MQRNSWIQRKRLTPLQRITLAYRQKYECATCHCLLPPMAPADHVVPLHQGGADCWRTNLQMLCHTCHADKTCEEILSMIEGEDLYTLKAVREEHVNPNGERIFLCEWEGYPKRRDWTWERTFNLETEERFHEYIQRRTRKRPRK